MALNKQIHLYSLATDSFYTDEEKNISDILSKWHALRSKLKKREKKIKNK